MSSLTNNLPGSDSDPSPAGRETSSRVRVDADLCPTVCDPFLPSRDWLDTLGARHGGSYARRCSFSGRCTRQTVMRFVYPGTEQAGREGLDRWPPPPSQVIDRARQHPSGRLDGRGSIRLGRHLHRTLLPSKRPGRARTPLPLQIQPQSVGRSFTRYAATWRGRRSNGCARSAYSARRDHSATRIFLDHHSCCTGDLQRSGPSPRPAPRGALPTVFSRRRHLARVSAGIGRRGQSRIGTDTFPHISSRSSHRPRSWRECRRPGACSDRCRHLTGGTVGGAVRSARLISVGYPAPKPNFVMVDITQSGDAGRFTIRPHSRLCRGRAGDTGTCSYRRSTGRARGRGARFDMPTPLPAFEMAQRRADREGARLRLGPSVIAV